MQLSIYVRHICARLTCARHIEILLEERGVVLAEEYSLIDPRSDTIALNQMNARGRGEIGREMQNLASDILWLPDGNL